MNDFAIGMLPSLLSGSFTKMFSNTSRFKEACKVLDREGFTKAGRGLMKHGNREGSAFPKPFGNTAEMNKRGQIILEEILNDPKNKVYQFPDGSLKVYSPNGRGVSYNKDGSFKGFIFLRRKTRPFRGEMKGANITPLAFADFQCIF